MVKMVVKVNPAADVKVKEIVVKFHNAPKVRIVDRGDRWEIVAKGKLSELQAPVNFAIMLVQALRGVDERTG